MEEDDPYEIKFVSSPLNKDGAVRTWFEECRDALIQTMEKSGFHFIKKS